VISLLRVDNRLLHGQILETWAPRLRARRVVVADDEAAASPLAQAAMTLCVPPDLPVDIRALATVDWAALAAAPEVVLVLVREVAGLARAAANGLTPALAPRLNLGNVHYAPGRKPLTPSVYLADEEVRTVKELAERGFEVEARAVPSDAPVGAAVLVEKYAAATAGR
jgi:PTS system N-acetylgalactosamine-specific IIB component